MMLAATFFYTATDVVVKDVMADVSMIQALWARYFFSLLVAVPIFVVLADRRPWRSRRPVYQALRANLMVVAAGCLFLAFRELPLGLVIAIFFLEPIIVIVLSVVLLGERVGHRRWLGVTAGFAGMLLIVRPGVGDIGWVAVLPLISATCLAVFQITTRQMSAIDGPLTNLFYLLVAGTAVMCLAAPFDWTPPTPGQWGLLVLIGILGFFAQAALILALFLAPASALAPFRFTQIIWALLGGYLFFAEIPDLWSLAGTLVIGAAGLYVVLRTRARSAIPPLPEQRP